MSKHVINRITTRCGLVILVDEIDIDLVSPHKWYANKFPHTTYATASINGATVYLHRFLLRPEKGIEVDHINHDGLDNRRSNLRLCTRSQNMANSRVVAKSTGFRGAYADPKNYRFRAEIRANGKRIRLGSFRTAESAAKAYDEAAARLFGEFAQLNFPPNTVAI